MSRAAARLFPLLWLCCCCCSFTDGLLVAVPKNAKLDVSPLRSKRKTTSSLDWQRRHQTLYFDYLKSYNSLNNKEETTIRWAFKRNNVEDLDDTAKKGGGIGGGGLLLADDAKSQLFSAFSSLQLSDQYDAVLTGLCAKILENPGKLSVSRATDSTAGVGGALEDPIKLIQEMNSKRIRASPRSLMAVIDCVVKTQDAQVVSKVVSLAVQNGGLNQYGSQQADILLWPPSPQSKVRCPDGKTRTRQERLDGLPDVPIDERSQEVAAGLAFGALVAGTGIVDWIGPEDIAIYANLLLGTAVAVGVVDNFYDILVTGLKVIFTLIPNKDNKNSKDKKEVSMPSLPKKEDLPFGLGSGLWTGIVVRGLTRLLTVDAEREAECEAAALLAAYVLGLPCFAFRPNALEGSILVVESSSSSSQQSSGDKNNMWKSAGIMRMLVWLMAPVAMERSKHAQLIMSDPREACGFLQRLEDYVVNNKNNNNAADGIPQDALWWTEDEQERADLLKWAYTEADLLLRDNSKAVKEISQRLSGGAATVGDCVAVMEQW